MLQNNYKQKSPVNYQKKSWGQYLRKIRLQLKLTIKDTAEFIQVSPCRLSEYERGIRLPTARTLNKITETFSSLGVTKEAVEKLSSEYQEALNSSNNAVIGRIRREIS